MKVILHIQMSIYYFLEYSNQQGEFNIIFDQLIFKKANIQIQQMNFKNNKRIHKSVSPAGDRIITPDCSKYTNGQTAGESNINGPSFKEFNQSPATSAYYYNRNKSNNRDDEFAYCTLSQINLELDNNMNEIIFLLGRRKALTQMKKRKIKQQMEERLEKARAASSNTFEYYEDEQFRKIVSFSPNTQVAIRILGKVITLLPELRGPRADQEDKSESFWTKNRQLQNQIDSMLQKMKAIDKNLEKQNHDVNQICKSLDQIEDSLKSIASIKSDDHLEKVEPLFKSKKKSYDALNGRVKQRQRIKDVKVEYIKRIKDALGHLKLLRQNRLHQITKFFGLDNVWDFEKYNFKDSGDFSVGFEQLLKIREKQGYLDLTERQVLQQLDSLNNEQELIYNELLRKQSDQAKAYHDYIKVMNQKIKYTSILSIFGDEKSHHKILQLNPSDISKKFKQYKSFLKRFMEEDSLIKQGLIKTNQTSQTFATILKAIQNQKQRRHQLLTLLENCIRKRGDYEHKKQDFRNLMVQITKNEQEHTQHEEELETILSDGDIQSYKKIGASISKCETQRSRLQKMKEKIENDLQIMDKQVVGMANRIQVEYEDILCEIVPADYEYSLKNSDDVKKLRNHLRKMYKRLGILNTQ